MRALLCLACIAWGIGLSLAAQQAEGPRTVIDADTLEMQGTDEHNYFYFRGNVHVSGDQLDIRCRELVITAGRGGEAEDTVGEIGAIERIVASGDVHISQAGRQAIAGRAEVDPRAGTVTLSDNPKIIDDEVEVEGYQFVFHTEDRRIETIADPDAPADQPSRSRVTLSSLPPIGFSQPREAIRVLDRLPPPPEPVEESNHESSEAGTPDSENPEESASE